MNADGADTDGNRTGTSHAELRPLSHSVTRRSSPANARQGPGARTDGLDIGTGHFSNSPSRVVIPGQGMLMNGSAYLTDIYALAA